MSKIMIMLLRFYQKFISSMKITGSCRFIPTCSTYSIQAYKKYGFFKGTILTMYRILRCNPFCKCGYDPLK